MLIADKVLSGCGTAGIIDSSNLTNVQLSGPNFRVIATNVSGESSSKALLGFSYGFGMAATQLALIPLDENRMRYKIAMEKLWSTFETSHGAITGRKLALVNLRYDSESVNTFFYTKVTTVVIADVVEFQ